MADQVQRFATGFFSIAMAPNPRSHVLPCSQPPTRQVFDMTDTSHDIRTLNGLIATTIDSVDGYRAAGEDTEAGRFATLFNGRADERAQVAEKLKAEVARLGGNPEDDGSLLAGAHRAFMGLKDIVTGKDEQAIVNEVERGEDVIKARYEKAMADIDLSPTTKALISDCYTSVKQGHDQMRDLKHSLQAAS
jgi:uncharacterized protein (TIGR02284 family)